MDTSNHIASKFARLCRRRELCIKRRQKNNNSSIDRTSVRIIKEYQILQHSLHITQYLSHTTTHSTTKDIHNVGTIQQPVESLIEDENPNDTTNNSILYLVPNEQRDTSSSSATVGQQMMKYVKVHFLYNLRIHTHVRLIYVLQI